MDTAVFAGVVVVVVEVVEVVVEVMEVVEVVEAAGHSPSARQSPSVTPRHATA